MPAPPGPVVVGVMRSEARADAVALGERVAAAEERELLLVCAYPYEGSTGHERPEYEALVRSDAEELLAVSREQVAAVPVRTEAVPSFAAARVLHETAEREDAAAIVIAATHRTATGTVADRLLTGARCPVAIAPKGYAARPRTGSFAHLGAALDPVAPAPEVLEATVRLARAGGAEVELLTVADPSVWRRDVWAGRATADELAAAQRAVLDRHAGTARDELAGVDVRVRLLTGEPVEQLLDASAGLDLLVCGSRAYGPASVVLVGGVSKALARSTRCPLLIVPRGATR